MSVVHKIAIVTPVLPERGGMGAVAWNHARLLAARGMEVALFSPDYGRTTPNPSSPRRGFIESPPAPGSPKTDERSEEFLGWRRGGDKGGWERKQDFRIELVKPFLQYGNAAWVPGLGRRLRGFDAVILHYPFFGGAGAVYHARKKYGFKLVVYYHMDVVGTGFKKIIFDYNTRYFLPRLIKRADFVLTSSEDLARHSYLGRYWQEGSGKFQVAPIGVDVNRFCPKPPLTPPWKGGEDSIARPLASLQNDNEKIVLFVGMLDSAHYFKGVEYLIKAVPMILSLRAQSGALATDEAKQSDNRDVQIASSADGHRLPRNDNSFKLALVGSGDLLPAYQKLARDLGAGDKIVFAGPLFGAELVPYFQRAIVTVLASVSSESFGIALVESMACGTPVIATDLPGPRSVYEDGVSGFTVPVRDSRAMAEKIEYLLSNPEKAREMGAAGRKLVEEKYDWEKIGDELLEFLISLASRDLRDLYDKS